MIQAESSVGGIDEIGAGQLKGRARGALVGALFGSGWMYWAVAFSGHPTPLWFLTVGLPAIAMVTWAIVRIRALRHLATSAADQMHWRAFRALFWAVTGAEWCLISIAAFVLVRANRADLIPQVAGLIVGLHFFPLATVFRTSRYYWLGGTMIVGAAGTFLLPRGDLRNIAGCALIGLCLWVSSAIALSRTSSLSR